MPSHEHAAPNFTRAFAWGVGLNAVYIAAEAIAGFAAGSLALLSDAGHNLSDVLGLLLAWGAHRLSQSGPTRRRTYGLRRTSILAALANALLLLAAVGAIVWEAVRRLIEPHPAGGLTIVYVAAAGVMVNAVSAWLFASGRKQDLNVRSAFTHLAADAGVSLGVVIAGVAIHFSGYVWIDPVVSLMVAAVIAVSTWSLLRDSVVLAIDAVPPDINPDEVAAYLENLEGVECVHHLHIWAMSTTETALTVHLVKPDAQINDALLGDIERELHDRFDIGHATIQFERDDQRCEAGSPAPGDPSRRARHHQ
ncbi:MAG TPA: cation diffusion facilitator family transporter [Chthoniobacterales bacterium]|nr:cation diffusion facilitator family transporter [Chthoniobacterales bacterium]